MLSEKRIFLSSGKLIGPKPKESILALLSFVEKHLADFPNKPEISNIENEDGLTQELCHLLNFHANGYPFWFQKEHMEIPEKGNSPRIDIAIFSRLQADDKDFFSFETKRLDYILKQREKEYVAGREENGTYINSGGIERFKKEIHGRNLNFAGMIGYVQKYDFKRWHENINSWIDELIKNNNNFSIKWNNKDKLIKEYEKKNTAKYISEHSRTKLGNIILFHLWVNLLTTEKL